MKLKSNPFAFIAATLLAAPALHAATWTGTTDASWATGTNWSGTQPDNVTAQAIVYDATSTANLTQTLNGSYTVTGITLTSPAGAVTVNTGTGTNTLSLGSGGIDLSVATQNLSLGSATASSGFNVTIGADQNWNVATGRTLTAGQNGGTLTLNNKLTLNGAGQVNFGGNGATTLTGSGEIVVSSGILQNNMQTGSLSTGRTGATTLGGGTLSIATSISMFGTGAINLNSGAIGSASGTGRDFGTGNAVNIGGDVQFGGSSGGLGNGYLRFGGTVDLGGAVRALNVVSSGVYASNGSGTILSGVISNGGITKDGAGILTITNNSNTLSGATTINAGTFVINQKSIANSTSVTINGTGALTLTENGTGTHDINNLSGASGATIRTDFNITGTATARTLKVDQTTDGTFAGSFSQGTGARVISLVKSGAAKLTLSGTGGHTGGTTISQGTLAAITNDTALGGSGTVTINDSNTGSNNTALLLGNITMARPITVANQGSGTTTLGANGSAALPTFSGAITLAKDVTLDGTGSTDRLTFSGGIGGTGNVTVSGGTNRVVFATTANNYSGTTTVSNNSILQLSTGAATANSLIPDASVVTVNSGSFLKLAKGANSETIGGLSGSGTVRGHEAVTSVASALVIDGGASQNFNGVLQDGGASGSKLSLTKTGLGTQTLSGINTYTGATTVNGGTLALGAGGSIANSPTISVGASGTLDVSASAFTLGISQTLTGSGTVIGTVANGTLGGTITASGGNLSIGSLTYSGDGFVNVTPGVAIVNVTNTDGLSTSVEPVTINVQGGALSPGQYPVIDYAGSIQGSGVGSFVVGSNPGGAYSYTLVDNTTHSTVDLVVASLADVWSGAFSNEWSTAAISGSKNWTLDGSPADYADGHDVQFTDAATGSTTVDISTADVTPASVAFNNSSKDYTLQGSAAIAGSADLTKAGTGTLTINNVNKFTGAVNIAGGTVSVASITNGGVDSPLGAGFDISLANGTLSYTGTTSSTDRSLTLTAPGTVDVVSGGTALTLTGSVAGSGSLVKTGAGVLEVTSGSGSFAGSTQVNGGVFRISEGAVWGGGAITNNSTIEVNRTTDLTLSNVISGTGALVKNGSGILTLSGASSYGGGVTINAGTVKASAANNLGTGAVAIGASATLNATAGMTLSTTLSGAGTLLKTGSGVLILTGTANTFSGLIDIQAGDVVLNDLGSENGTPNVTMSGGRFILSSPFVGNTATIGNLTGTAGIINPQYNATTGIRTLQVNQTVEGTFAGNIQDGGGSRFVALTKTGAATLTLTGTNNTYTGATTVNAGTLALGGSDVLADTTAVFIGAATLSVAASATDTVGALDPTAAATIQLGTGSALAFADSSAVDWTDGTLAITGTFVSGTSLRFGATNAGLTSTQLGKISCTGFTNFALDANGYLTASPANGYASWKTANGTTQTIDQDHDGDGVSNGVEFFFGGPNSTTGFTPQPGITGTSVTYTKHNGYTGVYGTDFVIETSESLTGTWTQETVGGNVVQSGDSFTYTFPAPLGAKKFVRLKVTGPQ